MKILNPGHAVFLAVSERTRTKVSLETMTNYSMWPGLPQAMLWSVIQLHYKEIDIKRQT